jgi:hypothetical protein
MIRPARGPMRYRQAQLLFRKGRRLKVFVPRDEVHDKAVRAAMVRHGWHLASVSGVTETEVSSRPGTPSVPRRERLP